MGIKETPTNIRMYYKRMKDANTTQQERLLEEYDRLVVREKAKYEDVKSNLDLYKDKYDIDLMSYEEFVSNEYITGTFFKTAKRLFMNHDDNYSLISDLFDIFDLATQQRTLMILKRNIELCQKCINLTVSQYRDILKTFYTEVHKKLILEGAGYNFGHGIGWTCINRVLVKSRSRKVIDYDATKKREAELIAAGKHIYNKEEAEWCAKNGIEYIAEDKRVFKTNEYLYEIPILHTTIKNYNRVKLQISDYRAASVRGKTNDELITECNNDINKICELPVDLKTKLTLCDKSDKILYTKFIRNETQESACSGQIDR